MSEMESSLRVAGRRAHGRIRIEHQPMGRATWALECTMDDPPNMGSDMVLVVEERTPGKFRSGVGIVNHVDEKSYGFHVEILPSTALVEWEGAR